MDRRLRRQIKDYIRSFVRPLNLMSVPEVLPLPPGQRVLVLSPHFDDDVLGCGGTLRKHVRAGHRVTVVYFTDGRQGDPSVADKALVGAMRKEEARRATGLLGIGDLVFLDEPETRLRPRAGLVRRVAEIVARTAPDVIYVPSFLESHVDHFEVNRILLQVATRAALQCHVCAYEVWTPLLPNAVVEISDVVEEKRRAVEAYASQIRQVDYVGTILGLNRYRSMAVLNGRGYAEAFLLTQAPDYLALLRSLGVGRRRLLDRRYWALARRVRGFLRPGSGGGAAEATPGGSTASAEGVPR